MEGYTLAEIKHAEEEENKQAQSELTGKEEDSDETGAKQSDKIEEDQVRLLYAYTHVSQTTLIVYYIINHHSHQRNLTLREEKVVNHHLLKTLVRVLLAVI